MAVSASEIERLKSSKGTPPRRTYTEEYRLEAVGHYHKAREIDPRKTIKGCEMFIGKWTATGQGELPSLNEWLLAVEEAKSSHALTKWLETACEDLLAQLEER